MSFHTLRYRIFFVIFFSLSIVMISAPSAFATNSQEKTHHLKSNFTTPLPRVGVSPQYDTTHVYVDPDKMDDFVSSFLATFGGRSTGSSTVTVTPMSSRTRFQSLQTPVGMVSVFAYKTPIPYPFGSEHTGYLVSDMDLAIKSARASGADILVTPFADAVGYDAIVQWPGGINMQLYWHKVLPEYTPLDSVPENRIYVSDDRIDAFIKSYLTFSHGYVVSDEFQAPGIEIGLPGTIYRRLRIESVFGKLNVIVTNGHLPFPYGREVTGYDVADIAMTIEKAKDADVKILVEPYIAEDREAAMLEFPGGYVAEIHSAVKTTDP